MQKTNVISTQLIEFYRKPYAVVTLELLLTIGLTVFLALIIIKPTLQTMSSLSKEIAEKNLARIIQARMEDIFDLVSWEIRKSGFERRLIGGIVLTGGGAQLRDIDKLAELHTGYSCRIGHPIEQLGHGYHEKLANPMFATAIGLLIKGFEEIENGSLIEQPTTLKAEEPRSSAVATAVVEEEEEHETSGKWYEQLFRKTREWFEADPDAEFK